MENVENSIIEKACYNTVRNERFVSDYVRLTTNELTADYQIKLTVDQVSKLLKTASLFSLSRDDKYQKLAFKIAVYLLSQYRKEYDSIPYAIEIILTRLGDIPAIASILKNEEGKDYFAFFGKTDDSQDILESYIRFPEVMAKKVTNIAKTAGISKSLALTDFQAKIFFMLRAGMNVSFSAPTSAGKSFMVHHYIAEKIKQSTTYCAIYIVPTGL
jgi:hypothetical protein